MASDQPVVNLMDFEWIAIHLIRLNEGSKTKLKQEEHSEVLKQRMKCEYQTIDEMSDNPRTRRKPKKKQRINKSTENREKKNIHGTG